MDIQWTDRRKGYRYKGFVFSEDGSRAKAFGTEYRERAFPAAANKRFNLWLVVVLLFMFPGVPLLAYVGLNHYLLGIGIVFGGLAYWLHGRIHVCPQCGRSTKSLSTPYMNSPVLYLCKRCRVFFEHGTIDGGLPWK